MRMSPYHMELAKRVAQGKKYQEISQEIQISQSRLSVLKANPLFQKQVRKYREMQDDGYAKVLQKMNQRAEVVADEILDIATSKVTPPQIRLQAAREVLDRLGMSTGVGQTQRRDGEDEVSFEQILRITKRRQGQAEADDESDYESAQADLLMDLESANYIPDEVA